MKKYVWELLENSTKTSLHKAIHGFLITLIVLNIFAVIIGTVREVEVSIGHWLHWFEIFSVVVFTIEYLARLWSCTESEDFSNPWKGRFAFIFTPFAMIDLVAILPFYLSALHIDLRLLRMLRLLRILRLSKLLRYMESLRLIGRVFYMKRRELVMWLALMLILVVITSSLVYYAEHGVRPDVFSSIPETMWWAIVTLTTVGYGDLFPVTFLGRFFAAITAISGIFCFVLPTTILGAAFVDELQKEKQEKKCCPHCGKEL
ncbi:MAG: potassium channel family protein [Candidatus Brocadiae bacterium]|nr:potassium channel family protein [Candidatus Brocadiia bacterium]